MRSSTTRVARLLADLADALSEFGAPWYVFGAQAAGPGLEDLFFERIQAIRTWSSPGLLAAAPGFVLH